MPQCKRPASCFHNSKTEDMDSLLKQLAITKDFEGLRQTLSRHQYLANEGMPYDQANTAKAPPLHRICDGVFAGTFTDAEAVQIAEIFLESGAKINGIELVEKKDTPLIAAASLHADQVAMLYIEKGADINHAGTHGGTALHWASWCGRPALVEKLIESGAAINQKCIDFKSTPLFWAVHGLKNGGYSNMEDCVTCVRYLLQAGADKNIPNADGKTALDLLDDQDLELKEILR